MPENSSAVLARLMDGYLTTQVLYIAAKLGIADLLAAGPMRVEALADATGVQAEPLRRVLRGLAAERVIDERPDDTFALAPLGVVLRPSVPGSLHGAIVARGDLYYAAAAGLLDAVRQGGNAFEHIHGIEFFEYQRRHPESSATFQASMTDRARREADAVVAAYDFTPGLRVVDVGAGHGVLLEAVLKSSEGTHGVLFDRPPVIDGARTRMEREAPDLLERCAFESGDFFDAVPTGGDTYVLSRVIHDWDDSSAIRILRACRAALSAPAVLLLVEAVLPERAPDDPAAIRMDLNMLTLLRGRERTAAEYAQLLRSAGCELRRVIATQPSNVSVLEASPR